MVASDSFPRRQARTRRFTLGEPRDFRVAEDGTRVAFLRSAGPVDPVNALWVLDVATATERLVVDPRGLVGSASDDDGTLSSAERSRRERVRETASGIVSYDTDPRLSTAVFALGGHLWRVSLDQDTTDGGSGGPEPLETSPSASERSEVLEVSPSASGGPEPLETSPSASERSELLEVSPSASGRPEPLETSPSASERSEVSEVSPSASGRPEQLASAPNVFDPRLSPDGGRVAYVSGSALRVISNGTDRLVAHESDETVSWGSAEFVAAEEMGRTRGHWWSPDGMRLLAARVDTAPVPRWWIADPAMPGAEPVAIRYPAAGEPNATVDLAVFEMSREDLDFDISRCRVDVAWNEGGWEYLAAVRWTSEGLLLCVQSRDQRTLGVLLADPHTGACDLLRTVSDDAWVELAPGSPQLVSGRLITVEDRGTARCLCVDGVALSDADIGVRAVHHVDADGVIVTASVDPAEVGVARVAPDGGMEWLTTGSGVNSVVAGGDTQVILNRCLERPGSCCTVRAPRQDIMHVVASHAAVPELELNIQMARLGSRQLNAAVLMPAGSGPADADGAPLPVLLDPYGGPHAQRVQRVEALFHTSQWFADQGFAVLVIDGRGTPGRGPVFERAVRGDLAGPVLEDQIEGLFAAANRWPRLDLSRVAIRGWSFGGYLAALAVLRRPDVFAAAVAGAPVTDWRMYDTHYSERYLGHPTVEPANYERTDLCGMADRLTRPLLLIHGLADDNVVAAHTLRLSRALLEAGRPHCVLPLSGVTHMTPQEQVAENLLHIQLRFLQQALKMPVSDPC